MKSGESWSNSEQSPRGKKLSANILPDRSADHLIGHIIDGSVYSAQGPLNLHSSTHRWLLSPEGVGALVRSILKSSKIGIETAEVGLFLLGTRLLTNPIRDELTLQISEIYRDILDFAAEELEEVFSEARDRVYSRVNLCKFLTFIPPQLGSEMQNSPSIPTHTGPVGQQLTSEDEPICPITLRAIPLEYRAISILCSDTGKPTATIYDRNALFKWLDTNKTDPITHKAIQCVVNAQGSIIYPVRVQSKFAARSSIATGRSTVHQIFPSSDFSLSKKEIREKRNFRNRCRRETCQRINRLKELEDRKNLSSSENFLRCCTSIFSDFVFKKNNS